MIVVDASAAISALMTDGASRTRLRQEQAHAPHLIDSEVMSFLRRRAATGLVSSDAGRELLARWARAGVTRYPVVPLLRRMWELRDDLSANDAGYVALAEALDAPLLTGDRRLARAPGLRCTVVVVPS